MDGELDRTERRIVGVLIEKSLSTPEYYPMTVNALVAGCNQKNNRDPVTNLQEFEIDGALRALFDKKWVSYVEGGGRTRKWRHRLDERLTLQPVGLAVMAELLLRGPQQQGELRTRAMRMANIPTPEAMNDVLDELGKRLPPLVVNIGRRPGERADRFAQTLCPDEGAAPTTSSPAAVPTAAPAPPAGSAAPEAPHLTSAPASGSLLDRLEWLELEVRDLRNIVEELRRPKP